MLVKSIILAVTLLVLWFAFRLVFALLSVNETASFQEISKHDHFEIRHYDEMVIAQTEASGDRSKAISNAFPKLFAYISGKNSIKKSIAMTTPVLQQQHMNSWLVSFIMPRAYLVGDLPTPLDKTIHLKIIQPTRYICHRFSGTISQNHLNKQLNKLNNYVQVQQIQVTGNPIYAFYNPPWTLPLLRRNEIWYQLAKIDKAVDDQHHVFEANKDHQKTHH